MANANRAEWEGGVAQYANKLYNRHLNRVKKREKIKKKKKKDILILTAQSEPFLAGKHCVCVHTAGSSAFCVCVCHTRKVKWVRGYFFVCVFTQQKIEHPTPGSKEKRPSKQKRDWTVVCLPMPGYIVYNGVVPIYSNTSV